MEDKRKLLVAIISAICAYNQMEEPPPLVDAEGQALTEN